MSRPRGRPRKEVAEGDQVEVEAPPAMSPQFGDLTPEYVLWMFEHKEEEARKVYEKRMNNPNVIEAMEALELE